MAKKKLLLYCKAILMFVGKEVPKWEFGKSGREYITYSFSLYLRI